MKYLIALWIALGVALANPVAAGTYDHEIDQYVITPCLQVAVHSHGLTDSLSEFEAVELMKIMLAANLDSMNQSVSSVVETLELTARMSAYELFKGVCVANMIKK